MSPKYREEVTKLLAGLDDETNQKQEPERNRPPTPEIHREIHYIFVREAEDEDTLDFVVDSDVSELDTEPLPAKPQPEPVSNAAIGVWLLGLLLPLFCIAVQLYFIVNPYTISVILDARERQLSLNGTLQLGSVLNPITLSQSATVEATGKGHQDAQSATGILTFYNGLFTPQYVPQGTLYTGQDGIQVATTESVTIPANAPPADGQAEVTAYALNKGASGNISAGDINITINNGLLVRNNQFSGGQDERNFQTVAKSDIDNAASPLKTTLDQSMQDTLSGQLKSGEALTSPTCTKTTTADHQAGQEAKEVKVTVSETCSAVVYNQATLQAKVTQLLTNQATTKLGSGYSMLDVPQVQVTQARAQEKTVVLSFTAQSAWIYARSLQEQQAIKKLIAGKNTDTALQLLTRLPGVERASMQSSGFGDSSRIPKDISSIKLALYYGL
jgi:hypothetical protein